MTFRGSEKAWGGRGNSKEKRQEMEAAGEWMGGLVKKEGGDHFIQRLVSKM